MEVYLVRHGEAKAETEDPARPLTDRGREEVGLVARHLAPVGPPLVEILHSDKLRARQTAEILAEHLRPTRGSRETPGLAPNDDPAQAARRLDSAREPIMLVGHLPHLGRLAALLLLGDPGREILDVGMGAVMCFARADGAWHIRWILTPELARPRARP